MARKKQEANTLLREARMARGWSQSQLAEKVGVTTQAERTWELGTRFPLPDSRDRLCQILDMTAEQLGISATQHAEQEPGVSTVENAAQMPLSDDMTEQEQNRQRMIQRVRHTWMGVLIDSLLQATLIPLGLKEQPDALVNPWQFEVQETNLPPYTLPAETSIVQVYDKAGGELLILGEPGAGKTTLLLELARHLLTRAEDDNAHPIPVLFNLSSWAQKREELSIWLVEELHTKYWVPASVAQHWINTNMLLLLLDGLDEGDEAARSACIRALNTYKQHYHPTRMVVCCRYEDYSATKEQLALGKAVVLQPLTKEQIETYLTSTGKRLESLRQALERDADLSDLVQTPLMLSVVVLAYQDSDVTPVAATTLEERRHHIFDLYIEKMLQRRGQKGNYSQEQIKRWLGWLASEMQEQNQTEFYVERINPIVLDVEQRQRYYTTIAWFINGISDLILGALFGWFRGGKTLAGDGLGEGLLGQIGAPPGNAIMQWMAPGIGGGLGGGSTVGLIMVLILILSARLIKTASYDGMSWTWPSVKRGLIRGLRQGLQVGLAVSVLSTILISFLQGPITGVSYGITFGLYGTLIVGLLALTANVHPKPSRSLLARTADALIVGVCAGTGFYLTNGLLVRSVQALPYAFIMCIFGGVFSLIDERRNREGRGFGTWMGPIEIIHWSWNNLKRNFRVHLRRGALLGLIVCLWVSLVFGITSAFFHGLNYGLAYGFIYGLICGGVIGGTAILIMVLNSGWTSGLLEEDHLRKPNEGIHRSLRHALFASLILGTITGVFSGVSSGLAFGLLGGLFHWPVLALGLGIACSLGLMYVFWIVYGGGACTSHLVLRLQLWRQGDMPLALVPFLEYAAERILLRKVGGGYIFVHRLLLEHFAAFPTNKRSSPIPK